MQCDVVCPCCHTFQCLVLLIAKYAIVWMHPVLFLHLLVDGHWLVNIFWLLQIQLLWLFEYQICVDKCSFSLVSRPRRMAASPGRCVRNCQTIFQSDCATFPFSEAGC